MPANRRVTVAEIAREAGVSLSTVSLALRGRGNLPVETRQRIQEIARELGYLPRPALRQLQPMGLSNLGMVIRTLPDNPQENPFYSVVQAGIEMACRQHRINLTYASLPVDRDSRILEVPRMLIEDHVDGLLVVGIFINEANAQIFERLAAPIVLVDAYAERGNYDAVVTQNAQGAYDAVAYLVSQGHRRIGVVGSHPNAFPSILARREGYLRALADHGGLEPCFIDSELDRQPAYEALQAHLRSASPVSAIFCVNDFVAVGALRAARDLGLEVPKDLSVIGFDDDLLAPHVTPALTTLQVDKVGLGRLAVAMLLDRFENPGSAVAEVALRPRLVVRESVAPRTEVAG